jgi:hypothetical protein
MTMIRTALAAAALGLGLVANLAFAQASAPAAADMARGQDATLRRVLTERLPAMGKVDEVSQHAAARHLRGPGRQ